MTTTNNAVDPNDPAPIACQKLIMEFSVHSVYTCGGRRERRGAPRACVCVRNAQAADGRDVMSTGYHPSVKKPKRLPSTDGVSCPLVIIPPWKTHNFPRCTYQARTPLYRSSPRGAAAWMPFGRHASFPRLSVRCVCYAQNQYAAARERRV